MFDAESTTLLFGKHIKTAQRKRKDSLQLNFLLRDIKLI